MTVEELIIYGKKYVHSIDAKMLLANLLHYDTLELLTHLDEVVKEEDVLSYQRQIEAFKNNKPLQYIIGNTNFYGYEFIVNEHVLIPRFETELLVEGVLNFVQGQENKHLKVLDLGCGSGAIGITLKKKVPELEVVGIDISKEALEVARENAVKLGADVTFLEKDMASSDLYETYYDIIVSNPPYIDPAEEIDSIVLENEPHLALFAQEEGTYFYRKILENIHSMKEKPKWIAFEIGALQKEKIFELAKDFREEYEIECRKDLAQKDRMIFFKKR